MLPHTVPACSALQTRSVRPRSLIQTAEARPQLVSLASASVLRLGSASRAASSRSSSWFSRASRSIRSLGPPPQSSWPCSSCFPPTRHGGRAVAHHPGLDDARRKADRAIPWRCCGGGRRASTSGLRPPLWGRSSAFALASASLLASFWLIPDRGSCGHRTRRHRRPPRSVDLDGHRHDHRRGGPLCL